MASSLKSATALSTYGNEPRLVILVGALGKYIPIRGPYNNVKHIVVGASFVMHLWCAVCSSEDGAGCIHQLDNHVLRCYRPSNGQGVISVADADHEQSCESEYYICRIY